MIKKQVLTFLLRWLISTAMMWICINLFASFKEGSNIQNSFWMYVAAGLIFSVINTVIKPIIYDSRQRGNGRLNDLDYSGRLYFVLGCRRELFNHLGDKLPCQLGHA